jgi:5-methylcytosine-specific restriction endonuclease McrA
MPYKDPEKQKEYMKRWCETNRDKILKDKKRYYEAHRKEISEKNKRRYEANPDKRVEYWKRYSEVNHDKIAEYQKQYYKANRDDLAAYDKCRREAYPDYDKHYREANRERITEYWKCYREANHDKLVERQKQWRDANPEKARAGKHRRRARLKGCEGSYTTKELNTLFEQQEGFCYYCGKLLYGSFDMEVHVDHKTPLSRGGTNYIENIALACAKCNLKKHTKTSEEYLSNLL